MARKKNTRKKKPSKSGKNRTALLSHKKVGSELQSGFAQLEDKLTFSSWSNERLPEMLWAAIIRVVQDQDSAIIEFRRVISFVSEHSNKEKLSDLSITGISKLDEELRNEFLVFLLTNPKTASALTVLKLFKELPARESWLKFLPSTEPDLDILMAAIGKCLPHQSQEATDCRWLKLMIMVVAGKFSVPKERVAPWFNYPYEGDQRSIRPSIRSCEIACNRMFEQDLTWSNNFWRESWENTPCLELVTESNDKSEVNCCDIEEIKKLRQELERHWKQTHSTTGVDAKHDGVFGIAFYALSTLTEIASIGVNTGILARLGLRTILEIHINLKYLILKDNAQLWRKWRTYGAGQAKLNALKFDELVEAPKFVSTETLETIAGEDLWEEFINIELGSWSGADLRKLSNKAGLKSSYDKYYSWSSTYSHGTWGADRKSVV